MDIHQVMDIPVSLYGNGPISLPLNHEAPIHLHITIPVSLLVKDFDPNTTQVPKTEYSRCWLATRLFGRRCKTTTHVPTKIYLVTSPVFHHQVWPKLSTLLFGKEKDKMYCCFGSDAKDWKRAGASNVSFAFSTGITDDDIDHVRAVVLKAGPDGAGGILFTAEEMGESDKAAWKRAWMVLAVPATPPVSDVEWAMLEKNSALYRFKAGWVAPQLSSEKESFESV